MRKVIVGMNVSLDGFTTSPTGELDWMVFNSAEMWDDLFYMFKTIDTFLLGRVTYQEWESYWPTISARPSSPKEEIQFSKLADRTQKIVFSKKLEQVGWKNTKLIHDHIREEIIEMKQQPGLDMMIPGVSNLISTFTNLGLVDEYRLQVNPVVLGGGKPLFKNVQNQLKLRLLDAKPYKTGIVALHYQAIH